ncbi:katanin p60 ATPase-containing subunit [Striga asiatica]|uniref:Katanin p60 ATPase-containing subunit n=1 Tax=Striga asiatica TaxID=4170 RepID=A0A5A7PMD2_STRAF|nr:katanin p60 ATPase-containing subunit [Striga asiatica]
MDDDEWPICGGEEMPQEICQNARNYLNFQPKQRGEGRSEHEARRRLKIEFLVQVNNRVQSNHKSLPDLSKLYKSPSVILSNIPATTCRRPPPPGIAGNRRCRPKSPELAPSPAARSREHRPATAHSRAARKGPRDVSRCPAPPRST